jgi:benzoyl-CoA reductase/2-hydroxyglutaryl-CoA dehydratase subunit BcrC/BadD/HgdB
VPEELLNLDGLSSFRMRATGSRGTDTADGYMGYFNCGYTRHCLEMGLEERYQFIDGFVFAAGCDHLRRLYDNWCFYLKPDFIHIMDVPHLIEDDCVGWYRDEAKRLCSDLAAHFNLTVDDTAVWEAIRRTNTTRRLLGSIDTLRRGPSPRLTGAEMHQISLAAASAPRESANTMLRELLGSTETRTLNRSYRARVLLIGSHLDDPSFIELIEDTGALVVADSFCCGLRDQLDLVEEDTGGDPFLALARRYLHRLSCPRMYADYPRRLGQLLDMARQAEVDGVIIEHLKFCEIWGVESNMLFRNVREQGIPTMRLERDYRPSSVGQIRTRVQAFIESMGK